VNARKLEWTVWVVVWLSTPTLLRAVDADGDGVDDAVDVCCETPPGVEVDAVGRPVADIDGDCDVDLNDFSNLQNNTTGPLTLGCCSDGDCDDDDPCTVDSCNEDTGACLFDPVANCGGTCHLGGSCAVTIACDVAASGTISAPVETDLICFCLNEGDLVRVAVSEQPGSGANFNPSWRILDASGNPAPTCGVVTTVVSQICGPFTAAGNPYRIEIEDGSRNDTGGYHVYFHLLPAVSACESTEILCDVPFSGTIDTPVDVDLLSFDVPDGGIARVVVAELAGSGPNFAPSWRLIDRAGNPARVCGAFGTAEAADCGPLPAAGNPYRIEIEDGARNDSGAYEVRLQQLPAAGACEFTPIACDVPQVGTIESAVDGDLLGFRVVEGEVVRVTVLENPGAGPGFAPSWRLLTGFGDPALSCGAFASSTSLNCGPLPAAGNPYRIEIEDNSHDDTGSYTVHLQRLTAARACDDIELVCDVTHADAIEHVADSDLLSFSVPEGETVRTSIFERVPSGANFNPSWRLLDGAGNPAPDCGAFTTTTSQDCGPLPEARNPYRIEIEDGTRNDTGTYDATITFLTTGCPQ